MSPIERARIKQRIYNLRLYQFQVRKLLDPANWSATYTAALQTLAYDHSIKVIDAAKMVHDFAIEARGAEIDMLQAKLGGRRNLYQNVVIFPRKYLRAA